ncbi:MAG: DUF4407 domain-containing protein [Bacteroidota bacterium]
MEGYSNYDHYEYEDSPQKMGPVKRFFFACAGAYVKILDACPSEHTKYVGIGATIFLTACLAVISGTFAINTLVDNFAVSGLFGILWGALIFNLDRYIVSSIRKEGRVWHEFGLALPRMILAVLISLVITKPIEVELFRNQIDSELYAYTSELQKEAEFKLDQKLGIDSLRQKLGRVDSLRIQYKQMRDSKPKSFDYEELSSEYRQAKSSYDSLVTVYKPRLSANQNRINYLWNTYAKRIYDTDDNGKKVFVRWDYPKKYAQQTNRLTQINKDLEKELAEKKQALSLLEKDRKSARSAFNANIEEELKFLASQRDEITEELKSREAQREAALPGVREKAEKYGVGLPAKIQTLEHMKDNDSSIWWMSNLIVLLFIMLETSPVFVKLITKRGPYDYLLSRIEHHKKVESLRQISDMNYDLSANMQLQSRRAQKPKVNGVRPEEVVKN